MDRYGCYEGLHYLVASDMYSSDNWYKAYEVDARIKELKDMNELHKEHIENMGFLLRQKRARIKKLENALRGRCTDQEWEELND